MVEQRTTSKTGIDDQKNEIEEYRTQQYSREQQIIIEI